MTSLCTCPLCQHSSEFYAEDRRRRYVQCTCCHLVFVQPEFLPSPEQELQEYQLHENDFNDSGYQRFLSRLATPLLTRLNGPKKGLDFGCGPAPLLARLLEDEGHSMSLYDPFFHPNSQALQEKYDFITCTEAIEHFHQPAKEIEQIDSLLNIGGWLAIMTKRVIDRHRFLNWHYKNDPTHVSFFSEATFEFIADHWGYRAHFVENDVVLMQKIR